MGVTLYNYIYRYSQDIILAVLVAFEGISSIIHFSKFDGWRLNKSCVLFRATVLSCYLTLSAKVENSDSCQLQDISASEVIPQVITVVGDLRDKAVQQEVLDKTLKTFRKVDILVRLVLTISIMFFIFFFFFSIPGPCSNCESSPDGD